MCCIMESLGPQWPVPGPQACQFSHAEGLLCSGAGGRTQALHAPPSLLSTQTPRGSADIHEQVECKLKITSQNMGGEKEGKENQNPEKSVYNYVHKKSGSGGCLPETGSMWVEGGQAGACVYTAYESVPHRTGVQGSIAKCTSPRGQVSRGDIRGRGSGGILRPSREWAHALWFWG